MAWTLAVDRNDLARTVLLEGPDPEPGEGEAVLRVDRVGVTANNVTYAVLGDSFRYWQFFPTEPGLGLVPLWGFAEVAASNVEGVRTGVRVYGYLPPSTHLVVRPGKVEERAFRDVSEHRAGLPSPYNTYVDNAHDPAYDSAHEDLQILYRPLFFTSFMLADKLEDEDWYGADVVVLSSASSKTAYGTAFLLRGAGPEVVGLTSPANVAFTEGLGCYDRVLPYEGVAGGLDASRPTAYLDVSGRPDVRTGLRDHLGESLVHDAVVGVTSQEPAGADALAGGATVFFAPDQMRKRAQDWGREGLDDRFATAWRRFVPAVQQWVDVVEHAGPDGLEAVWLETLAGRSEPRAGHVVSF